MKAGSDEIEPTEMHLGTAQGKDDTKPKGNESDKDSTDRAKPEPKEAEDTQCCRNA